MDLRWFAMPRFFSNLKTASNCFIAYMHKYLKNDENAQLSEVVAT